MTKLFTIILTLLIALSSCDIVEGMFPHLPQNQETVMEIIDVALMPNIYILTKELMEPINKLTSFVPYYGSSNSNGTTQRYAFLLTTPNPHHDTWVYRRQLFGNAGVGVTLILPFVETIKEELNFIEENVEKLHNLANTAKSQEFLSFVQALKAFFADGSEYAQALAAAKVIIDDFESREYNSEPRLTPEDFLNDHAVALNLERKTQGAKELLDWIVKKSKRLNSDFINVPVNFVAENPADILLEAQNAYTPSPSLVITIP